MIKHLYRPRVTLCLGRPVEAFGALRSIQRLSMPFGLEITGVVLHPRFSFRFHSEMYPLKDNTDIVNAYGVREITGVVLHPRFSFRFHSEMYPFQGLYRYSLC